MGLPELPRVERQRQLSDTVYESLKDAIVEDVLAPGQRLVESSTCPPYNGTAHGGFSSPAPISWLPTVRCAV